MAKSNGRTKVKTETVYFHRDTGNSQFVKIIYVDNQGVFYAKLPPEVASGLGCAVEVSADKLDVLDRLYQAKLDAMVETRRKTRKVIVYEFNFEDGYRRAGGAGMSFVHGLAINVQAAVFNEIETEIPQKKSNYEYVFQRESKLGRIQGQNPGELIHGHGKQESVLDWTPEREAFFVKMQDALLGLIQNMKATLRSPENLILFIEKNIALLPPPSSPLPEAENDEDEES